MTVMEVRVEADSRVDEIRLQSLTLTNTSRYVNPTWYDYLI